MMTGREDFINSSNEDLKDVKEAEKNKDGSFKFYGDDFNYIGTYKDGDDSITKPYNKQKPYVAKASEISKDGEMSEAAQKGMAKNLGMNYENVEVKRSKEDGSYTFTEYGSPVAGLSEDKKAGIPVKNEALVLAGENHGGNASYFATGEYHPNGSDLGVNDAMAIESARGYSDFKVTWNPEEGAYTGTAKDHRGSEVNVMATDMAYHPEGAGAVPGYKPVYTLESNGSRLSIGEMSPQRNATAASAPSPQGATAASAPSLQGATAASVPSPQGATANPPSFSGNGKGKKKAVKKNSGK